MEFTDSKRWFWIAASLEAALIPLSFILGWVFDWHPAENLRWNGKEALLGIFSALLPFAGYIWILGSEHAGFRRIQAFLDDVMRRLFGNWNILQLAAISILAGLGEELLFRGFLQGILEQTTNAFAAVAISSIVFGMFHLITPLYALITIIMGVYIGLIYMVTDSLLIVIMLHAVYDFAALMHYLRIHAHGRSHDTQ
ncbi:MAG: CPBP family intramembrane metalloprotease [Verrucomicrobia bacterium]|nr:CPBP family intramembrane metalloprotease [Verrucomicrobiota bacterium]